MKKVIAITIIALLICGVAYSTCKKKDNKKSLSNKTVVVQQPVVEIKEVESVEWKTYTNDKYGFSFQYPATWILNGREYHPVGANGQIMSVMFMLVDTVTTSNFYLNYHLEPYGKQFFEYLLTDYNASANMYAKGKYKTTIAGSDAIVAVDSFYVERSSEKDIIHIPVHFSVFDFLDKKGTGAVELQFKIPVSVYDKEIVKYNKILSSFAFLP